MVFSSTRLPDSDMLCEIRCYEITSSPLRNIIKDVTTTVLSRWPNTSAPSFVHLDYLCQFWHGHSIFLHMYSILCYKGVYFSQTATKGVKNYSASARLEYLRQYWPRHCEILDMYSTLCCERILGIFFWAKLLWRNLSCCHTCSIGIWMMIISQPPPQALCRVCRILMARTSPRRLRNL